MFHFFHPRPVIDGRAVAVKVVQQATSARQDTHTLVVPARHAADRPVPHEESAGNPAA